MNRPVLIRATIYILRLLIGLSLTFILGGARPPATDVVIEQLQIIGAWQWLAFLTGSIGVHQVQTLQAAVVADADGFDEPDGALAPANDNAPAARLAQAS
jgi:hypothetical protein